MLDQLLIVRLVSDCQIFVIKLSWYSNVRQACNSSDSVGQSISLSQSVDDNFSLRYFMQRKNLSSFSLSISPWCFPLVEYLFVGGIIARGAIDP